MAGLQMGTIGAGKRSRQIEDEGRVKGRQAVKLSRGWNIDPKGKEDSTLTR